MNHSNLNYWRILKGSRLLRTLIILIFIFFLAGIVLQWFRFSYRDQITQIQADIKKDEEAFIGLKRIIETSDQEIVGSDISLVANKAFADFEEVVPFIGFLENLFVPIDPEVQVIIRGQQSQIFMDHYADYHVSFKIPESFDQTLYEALYEIEKSSFITKLMSLDLKYNVVDQGQRSRLSTIEMSIRLYLK
ncbi:hypothetical protein IPJ72_05225 [Candidatus Peregrinibacteria bacterium]|nr:MAG: hypothetical protein IPJ72_05225 [Candidatus Peregrinibacteria bacterium]